MNLIPNFIKNASEIVAECELLTLRFKPRVGEDEHSGFLPDVFSKFKTLKHGDMSPTLLDLIFDKDNLWDDDTKYFWHFIQIQKYDIFDYIVPHRDSYFVKKIHLVSLTTSDKDGLVVENANHEFTFIPDKAGQYIDFPYDAIHYVSPVTDHTRYSIVVGV